MTEQKINELIELQWSLLEGLFPLLSPGGRIVYATCTIHPRENFQQINSFLDRHSELRMHHEQQLWPRLGKPGDGFYTAAIDFVG